MHLEFLSLSLTRFSVLNKLLYFFLYHYRELDLTNYVIDKTHGKAVYDLHAVSVSKTFSYIYVYPRVYGMYMVLEYNSPVLV